MHDWCYTTTSCMFLQVGFLERHKYKYTNTQIHNTTTSLSHPFLQYNLPYFVPYKWRCNGGSPYCIPGNTKASGPGSCSHQVRFSWPVKATFLKLFEIPSSASVTGSLSSVSLTSPAQRRKPCAGLSLPG